MYGDYRKLIVETYQNAGERVWRILTGTTIARPRTLDQPERKVLIQNAQRSSDRHKVFNSCKINNHRRWHTIFLFLVSMEIQSAFW